MPAPRFSPKGIAFLRALKRNNRRDWFTPRKDQYEELLRKPMLDVVEHMAIEFGAFAPELSAGPKSVFRIYRDTRFSSDKTPYKTNVAAYFPNRGLPKNQGAALYMEVAPAWVWVGGGLYHPESPILHKEREHIAGNLRRFRAIVESPAFRRRVGPLEGGELLQRVPRGFAADHPAESYLRFRMFVAGKEFPASFATSPRFCSGLVDVFKHLTPLIRFLNEPLTS